MNNYKKIIEVFKKDKKNPTKTYNLKFDSEIDISKISITDLKKIIKNKMDDEDLYLMYTLDAKQVENIQKKLNIFFNINHKEYFYFFTQISD